MYKHVGKQVLVRYGSGWAQFADAASEGAAATIVAALNPPSEAPEIDVPPRPRCRAYQASDQMICPCGRQWDVNDSNPPRCYTDE